MRLFRRRRNAAKTADHRLEQGLHRRHARRLPVPDDERAVQAACPPTAAARPTSRHDDARRPTAPYVVRWERGTIDRFIYCIAMLAPPAILPPAPGRLALESPADLLLRRRRGDRPQQGRWAPPDASRRPRASQRLRGRVLDRQPSPASTTTSRSPARPRLMMKEHFIEGYGVPLYMVGIGGSGGGIQQYVYGQNHPGLIDAAIPHTPTRTWSRSPSMSVTANCSSTSWTSRTRATRCGRTGRTGHCSKASMPATPSRIPTRARRPSECVNGWRGLTPLVLNPHFGSAVEPELDDRGRDGHGQVDALRRPAQHLRRQADGFARANWDNVGVQYGLQALASTRSRLRNSSSSTRRSAAGRAGGMVQEGARSSPGGTFDPWSPRNMSLSPDGGVTPAPRTQGDMGRRAPRTLGLVFTGTSTSR